MLNRVNRFAKNDSGATAIEYALIAMLVAVGIVASVTALGGSLESIFDMVASTVSSVSSQ